MNHHSPLIQCRQVKLLPRGFCGCRVVHVPESDKVDRPVTADAGPPCQARIPTALKDKVANLVGSVVPGIAKRERHACCKLPQCPRKERSKYHASGIKREACGDGCGQASPSQCSRKRESSMSPKLHLHFDALKISGLTVCGASVSDSFVVGFHGRAGHGSLPLRHRRWLLGFVASCLLSEPIE